MEGSAKGRHNAPAIPTTEKEISSVYQYDPLHMAEPTIRILELRRGSERELICTLTTVPLRRANYQALSYVWGNPAKPHSIEVVNGKGKSLGSLPLTNNVYNALCDLRRCNEIDKKIFWIDQICINQEDDEEKSSQVAMMGEVYEHAQRVITYIGPEAKHDAEALDLVKQLHQNFKPNYEKLFAGNWFIYQPEQDDLPVQLMPESVSDAHPGWPGLLDMVFGDWTQRLWMVQENLLNANNVMLRGDKLVAWVSVAAMAVLFGVGLLPLHLLYRFWNDCKYSHEPKVVINPLFSTAKQKLGFSSHSSEESLVSRLAWYKSMQCQDPRDHIYALLAISDNNHGIKANYHQSCASVYIDATFRLIKSMNSLQALSLVSRQQNLLDDGFPSWCMNPLSNDEISIGWEENSFLNVDSVKLEENNAVLVLAGQIVGEISFVTAAVGAPISNFFDQVDEEIVQRRHGILSNIVCLLERAGTSLGSVRNLACVTFLYQNWTEDVAILSFWGYLNNFYDLARMEAKELNMAVPTNVETIENMIQAVGQLVHLQPRDWSPAEAQEAVEKVWGDVIIHGRSFCITSDNQMCNATSKVREGDFIALLHGFHNPVILRPDGDYFKFVGDAYVHALRGVKPDSSSHEIRLR